MGEKSRGNNKTVKEWKGKTPRNDGVVARIKWAQAGSRIGARQTTNKTPGERGNMGVSRMRSRIISQRNTRSKKRSKIKKIQERKQKRNVQGSPEGQAGE